MCTNNESDFPFLFDDVGRRMRTHADRSAREHGMTRVQLVILARLERQPGLSQNELAVVAEISPIAVTRVVDRLEAFGLIERCPDPVDRRIWRLRSTPAAAAILRDIGHDRAKLLHVVSKSIDPAVLDTMLIGKEPIGKAPVVARY